MTDETVFDELLQLVGDQILADADPALLSNAEFIEWLAEDCHAAMGSSERAELDLAAAEFAHRISRTITARRLAGQFPVARLVYRDAGVIARAGEAQAHCRSLHCAPLLDLRVAAGQGRDLWEEECDTWIEVPAGLPDSRYLALRVAGDSMTPLLQPRDVILIELGTLATVDDLVVARRTDDGYVVKRVNRIDARDLELESLNPTYDSITVPNDSRHVLGTVVARFRGD